MIAGRAYSEACGPEAVELLQRLIETIPRK
jgi:hypothetical protein